MTESIQYLIYAIYALCAIVLINAASIFLVSLKVRRLEETQNEIIEDFYEDEP